MLRFYYTTLCDTQDCLLRLILSQQSTRHRTTRDKNSRYFIINKPSDTQTFFKFLEDTRTARRRQKNQRAIIRLNQTPL